MELYKKYRPVNFKQVVGQDDVIRILVDFGKRKSVPHCLLFVGPSGCGKTTIARILRKKIKCGDADFQELNVADFRGIDMVRDLRSRMTLSPMTGDTRVWLIDECASLTKDAQNAFLKILEDTPDHVYFFLATTDPQKLLRTIRTRATEIQVKPLTRKGIDELFERVVEGEGKEMPQEEVVDKIFDLSAGSPRKALVLLDQVLDIKDIDQALDVLTGGANEQDVIELARMLLNPKTQWSQVAKFLKGIDGLDEQVESIRWLVLSYMSTVILNNGANASRAFVALDAFRDHFYDCKKAGLILACRETLEQ